MAIDFPLHYGNSATCGVGGAGIELRASRMPG